MERGKGDEIYVTEAGRSDSLEVLYRIYLIIQMAPYHYIRVRHNSEEAFSGKVSNKYSKGVSNSDMASWKDIKQAL